MSDTPVHRMNVKKVLLTAALLAAIGIVTALVSIWAGGLLGDMNDTFRQPESEARAACEAIDAELKIFDGGLFGVDSYLCVHEDGTLTEPDMKAG